MRMKTMIDQFHKDMNFGVLDQKTQVLLDRVYNKLFPIKEIKRFATMNPQPNSPERILDRELGIDVLIETTDGIPITIQEKVRRESHLNFNDFTLEYMSNVQTKTKGEYFHLHADFYSYAWVNYNQTEILRHYIFNIPSLKYQFSQGIFDGKYTGELNDYHSQASFIALPFNEFPKELFIYKQGEEE